MIGIDSELVREIVQKNKRLDGRGFEDYRNIAIETGFITSAEGSARVRIGDTEVVAGVKMGTGEPYPDSQEEGVLMVGAELLPLAHPDFESGPPGEKAIEIARVVDRAIRESKCIDFAKLCITPKEKVWMVFVDIDVLDNDGNLIDAAGIAAMAALMNARIPELDADGNIIAGTKTEKLPISGTALSTTFVKINGNILVDPGIAEEEAMEARLTVGTLDKGVETYLCSMQKGGPGGLTAEEIEKIISLAIKKGDELREKLRDADNQA